MPSLPFAKIYRKIYDGPLRADPVKRAIFVDMCVLADANGRVEMDYPFISAITGWPPEMLLKKIGELTRPEPSSSNQKEEGAPLRPLSPGCPYGWQIVNFAYYRKLRPRNDERRKAYRREWMRNKRKQSREHCEPREQTVNKREQAREQGVNTETELPGLNGHQPNELSKPREQGVNRREHAREQNVNPTERESLEYKKKSSAHPAKPNGHRGLVDSEWLARLVSDSAYSGINVSREFGKMANWCKVNRKLPTRSRFVNWLNRIEVVGSSPGIIEEEEATGRDPPRWRDFLRWRYSPEVVLPDCFNQLRPADQREYEHGYAGFLAKEKK